VTWDSYVMPAAQCPQELSFVPCANNWHQRLFPPPGQNSRGICESQDYFSAGVPRACEWSEGLYTAVFPYRDSRFWWYWKCRCHARFVLEVSQKAQEFYWLTLHYFALMQSPLAQWSSRLTVFGRDRASAHSPLLSRQSGCCWTISTCLASWLFPIV